MKKLLLTILFTLVLSGGASAKIGKGEVRLNETVVKSFIKFLRNEYGNYFMITPNGNNSLYTICGAEFCKGGMGKALKWCKEDYGQKCLIFAQRKKQKKIIRWNNVDYTFPEGNWEYNAMVNTEYLKSKNEGINQSISDDQIKSVLSEFGYISFNKAVASEKKIIETNQVNKIKVEPKTEKKLTQQQQIEVDQLKEMLDIGALTKDEYDTAVKRILN